MVTVRIAFCALQVEWEGKILRAKGVGSKLHRRFQFEPVADAPPLESDLTLSEVVASLEQAEHRDSLASLPRGWFYMPLKRKQLVAELLGTQLPSQSWTSPEGSGTFRPDRGPEASN